MVVEEDRVQELTGDFRWWRVAMQRGTCQISSPPSIARGERQDAVGPQVHGRGQRRDETDSPVTVPRALEVDGGKDQRQRSGRHDVIDGQPTLPAQAEGPLPLDDVPSLDPRDRAPGRVAAGHDRNPGKVAHIDVAGDTGNLLASPRPEGRFERATERSGIDQPPKRRTYEPPSRQQSRSPVPDVAHE